MFRKLMATITATVIAFALFPVLAAYGAATTGARLIGSTTVFPGAHSYTVHVEAGLTDMANRIRVTLPPGIGTPVCGAAVTLWTCQRMTTPGAEGFIFSGGPLAPNSTVDFPIGVTVKRPNNADRSEAVRVEISADAGTTYKNAPAQGGTLTINTRVLEVISGSPVVTGPPGAVDGTGTAGQVVNYSFRVRNHAAQTLSVTPTFASNGNDTAAALAARNIAAGATATVPVSVTLGTVTGSAASRTPTFTFDANATGANGVAQTATYVVERSPELTLDRDTFSNWAIQTVRPQTYTFAINANKQFLPGVGGLAGSLAFAGNEVAWSSPTSLPRNPANPVTLEFGPVSSTDLVGADGTYDAVFTFSGTDDNGAAWTRTATLEDLITIDNLAPSVTVDLDLPGSQVQVKDGDTVDVSGTVSDASPLTVVEIQASNGATFPVEVTRSGNNFSGSATVDGLGSYGSIVAFAEARDAAGNPGSNFSVTYEVDNVLPVLSNPATVFLHPDYGSKPVIAVTFAEQFQVYGACNAALWRVDGTAVVNVLYNNGEQCIPSQPSPTGDNIRILVLATTIDEDDPRSVTYAPATPAGTAVPDRGIDGAANAAVQQAIDTVSGIAPDAPTILSVSRNAGTETATFDEGQYWTRFGGNDAVASIGGARGGYRVQVLAPNGAVLASADADGDQDTIPVPVGTAQASYLRRIRLINANGIVGDTTDITITVDQVSPRLQSATVGASPDPVSGMHSVTVTFDEKLQAGVNRGQDWWAVEDNTNAGPDDNPYWYYGASRVTGSGDTRVLEVDLGENGPFVGAEYDFFVEEGALRYVDRAGNQTGDGRTF